MRVAKMAVALACAGLLLTGCNQNQQKQAPTDQKQEQQPSQEGQKSALDPVKLTDEQKKEHFRGGGDGERQYGLHSDATAEGLDIHNCGADEDPVFHAVQQLADQ